MEGKKRTSEADRPPKRQSLKLQKRRSISWHTDSMLYSKGQNSDHHPSHGSFSGGGGGGGGPANATRLKMEIESQQALYMQHWEDRNLSPLAELYTSGCSIMPPEASINFGRPGMKLV